MTRVVVTEYLSLNGVMENPAWTTPYWSDEIAKFKYDELFASDALLLGRVTYQGFAQAWPSMKKDEQGFTDRMNSLPKVVATRTLTTPEWNARFIHGDVAAEVARLKQQPGQDLLVYGSSQLVQTLVGAGLVDRYHLLVYPLVLGSGKRLFHDGTQAKLRLVACHAFGSGVVALTYEPDRSA